MEITQALRSTPASREFTDRVIEDETLAEILDDARFAPSGGNRQAWRVIIVKDPERRLALKRIYLPAWYEYLAQVQEGIIPFGVFNDRELEAEIRLRGRAIAKDAEAGGGGFAEHLDEVPALLLVLADLSALATVDRDLDRYQFAGGASIYPFVWNILLAARERGLGGVITTMAIVDEPALKDLFKIPDQLAVAALVALGEPAKVITKLRRSAVEEFTTLDTFEGSPFGA